MSADLAALLAAVDDLVAYDLLHPAGGGIGTRINVLHDARLAAAGVTVSGEGLREALVAIRDMEPDPVDESLPDHSECVECKRIRSTPHHPSSCCDELYRALRQRDARWRASINAQQHRMRDLAQRALAATPEPAALDVERLARALVKATREQAGEPDGPGWPGYIALKPKQVIVTLVVRELAAAIAREYAHQSDTPEAEG